MPPTPSVSMSKRSPQK